VTDDAGLSVVFTMEPYRREMLLRGLDQIGRTLLEEPRIAEFERGRA
jgi:3-isopropylmalate dehydratase small subunit